MTFLRRKSNYRMNELNKTCLSSLIRYHYYVIFIPIIIVDICWHIVDICFYIADLIEDNIIINY